MSNGIREARTAKNISQLRLRDQLKADGHDYSESVIQRIEAGGKKTTEEEVELFLKTIEAMPEGARKVGGRPRKEAAEDLL